MNIKKVSLLAATALASLVATTGVAQTNSNLVRASISVTCVSTNTNGNLIYDYNNTSDFIADFVTGLGITNLNDLSLVINLTNSSLQVVRGTNQTLVGTALTFTNGLFLMNSNQTVVELQSDIRVGTNTTATGVLTATEQFGHGASNDLASFSLFGQLSYIEPAVGTNPPSICRGKLIVFGKGEFEDNDHQNGNNGHRGEGNNGNGQGNGGPNGSFDIRHPFNNGNSNGNGNNNNNGNNGNNGNRNR